MAVSSGTVRGILRLGAAAAAFCALLLVSRPASAQESSSAAYHSEVEQAVAQIQYPGQYPNRGGYPSQPRPAYHPNQGSDYSRLALEFGGGFNAPVGGTGKWQTVGGNVTIGAGLNFTSWLGLLAEYQFNGTGIPNSTLTALGEPDGHVHIWSLTLDPVLYLTPHRRLSPYVTGGGGFYRKVTSYTQPVFAGYICDYYGYCYPDYENVLLSHFSSNQGGMNLGGGLTWKLSETGHAKLYAEARYTFVDSAKPAATMPGTGTVSMIPISFGVRF